MKIWRNLFSRNISSTYDHVAPPYLRTGMTHMVYSNLPHDDDSFLDSGWSITFYKDYILQRYVHYFFKDYTIYRLHMAKVGYLSAVPFTDVTEITLLSLFRAHLYLANFVIN